MPDPTYNLRGGFKPTIKRFADLGGPDFFSTPRWATFALIHNEKFSGEIWECACGDGTVSKVLAPGNALTGRPPASVSVGCARPSSGIGPVPISPFSDWKYTEVPAGT